MGFRGFIDSLGELPEVWKAEALIPKAQNLRPKAQGWRNFPCSACPCRGKTDFTTTFDPDPSCGPT